MRKERKHFTPEEKVAILRRHLLDKAPSRSCVKNWACAQPCSTAGSKSCSRMAQQPFRLRSALQGEARNGHWTEQIECACASRRL